MVKDSVPPTFQSRLGFSMTDVETGFGSFCRVGLTVELAEVFQAMQVYESIVDAYSQGTMAPPDMAFMVDQRNLVTHAVMSLPAASEYGPEFLEIHPIYEACRLAAITYAVGVLFPLPASAAPFPTLVRDLKAALEESNLAFHWPSASAISMLLWVLTIGGIAAQDMPERQWYLETLRKFIGETGLLSWPGLRTHLKSILWLDIACEPGGLMLWNETGSHAQYRL
jgi:hypothetical protein